MTRPSTVSRNDYTGAGSAGPFPYSFPVFALSELRVVRRAANGTETVLVNPSDFTTTDVFPVASGSITLTTALATGELLTIRRAPALTQPTSFRNLGSFFPETHEDSFDHVMDALQYLFDAVGRAPRLKESYSPLTLALDLVGETGKVLTWQSATALGNSTLDASAVALPGVGRTVATLTAYLLNNAVYNVKDYGAKGDNATDDRAAIQLCLDSAGTDTTILFPPGTYRVLGYLKVNKNGQRIIGYDAVIACIGVTTSGFVIGDNGFGVFVRTTDILLEGLTLTGQADGVGAPGSPPVAFNVLPPTNNPYVEGVGCSRISIVNCVESGFCVGIQATGADAVRVTGCTLGSNRYYLGLGAGGYGVLMQTCFNVRVRDNTFLGAANDRHAIYISADPNRTFDDNNKCKDVVVQGNRFNWTVNTGLGFESVLVLRAPDDCVVNGNVFRGGYGGVEFDSQNGNGRNIGITGNTFDGQVSNGVSERACVIFSRTAGAYVPTGITISSNTFRPSGTFMHCISLFVADVVNVIGNDGTVAASIDCVAINGTVTNAYFGQNTWRNNAQYTYVIAGTLNDGITFGVDKHKLTGGGVAYNFITVPTALLCDVQSRGLSADRGDASVTVVAVVDDPEQLFATNLTVNRTFTLSNTNVHKGAHFRIVRTGLGAFTLTVQNAAAGLIKQIPISTAAFVDVEHDGTAWRLVGYGTL